MKTLVELAGKRALVVGLARSGVAAARLLRARGARVVATDRKPEAELKEEVLRLAQEGVRLELGGHREASFAEAELVVVSPGVAWDAPELEAARRAGAEVIAEIELGYREAPGTVAAVTGTKGKSTTTAALGAMLREAGPPAGGDVRVGGNIGSPLTGLLDGASAATTFVLEVSSFQLEGIVRFHPHVAVFLNLSADHLDRHPSLEAYAAAKARVFENQGAEDWAVVNADDPALLALAREARARRIALHPRGLPAKSGDAAWFEAGLARLRRDGRVETLFRRADVRLPGRHLAGDLLAAGAAAHLLGAPAAAIARAAAAFPGSEHVLERVAELRGVAFFNDSKATNIAAAQASLEAFDRPVVAIMGGKWKGGDLGELRETASRRVRCVFAIGEARERFALALASRVPVLLCGSLREAVEGAWSAARPGDVVLLAPACASFDMFEDYAARGRAFKDEVRRLAEQESGGARG
jgi:UDP-N-acetylmuramoylalanine--D-glutamate ligase